MHAPVNSDEAWCLSENEYAACFGGEINKERIRTAIFYLSGKYKHTPSWTSHSTVYMGNGFWIRIEDTYLLDYTPVLSMDGGSHFSKGIKGWILVLEQKNKPWKKTKIIYRSAFFMSWRSLAASFSYTNLALLEESKKKQLKRHPPRQGRRLPSYRDWFCF